MLEGLIGRRKSHEVGTDESDQKVGKEAVAGVSLVLETIVKGMVDKPLDVHFSYSLGSKTIVCSITTGEGDAGHLIGRQGRNADSIRQVMRCVAKKYGVDCVIEID